jgi:DNA-binding CsgD family transcriptional regulator
MKPDSMSLVYELWDELNAFPASRTDDALVHLMQWFRRHLDADNVIWLGGLRMFDEKAAKKDPLLGWRLRVRKSFVLEKESYRQLVASYFSDEHYGRLTPAFFRKGNRPDADVHIGMATWRSVREAGAFRVHRLRDGWIDYAKFRRTEHYRLYYTENDIADRIWVFFPVSPTVESIFLIDRHTSGTHPRRRFTKDEADLTGAVLRGAGEFHRRLLLLHGVFRNVKALTPLKLRILQELLSSKSEKEIATATGHRPMTLRKYVKELYAEFGVKTRPGLMSLWLGEP